MVQASAPLENLTPFENWPKSTIQKPDMSGFRIPTVVAKIIFQLKIEVAKKNCQIVNE